MIYVTGDTHGDFDRIYDFCQRMNTNKEDLMVILGDAGVNYYLYGRDDLRKEFIEQLPITFLCIHGNHEQRPYAIAIGGAYSVDKSTEIWLGEIEGKLEYQKWFCGHYHTQKTVDKIQIMFKDYEIL